MGTGGKPT